MLWHKHTLAQELLLLAVQEKTAAIHLAHIHARKNQGIEVHGSAILTHLPLCLIWKDAMRLAPRVIPKPMTPTAVMRSARTNVWAKKVNRSAHMPHLI